MFKPWNRLCQVHVHYKGSSGGVERIITEDQRAAAEVASQQWNDYQTRFVPFENKFLGDVTRGTETMGKQIKGAVNADVMQKITQNQPAINPNSGMTNNLTMQDAASSALSKGVVKGGQSAEDQQAAALNTATALGRGQAVDALNGQMSLAEASGQAALSKEIANKEADWNTKAAIVNSAGSAIGAGAAYGASNGWFKPNSPAATQLATNLGNTQGNSLLSSVQTSGPSVYNATGLGGSGQPFKPSVLNTNAALNWR